MFKTSTGARWWVGLTVALIGLTACSSPADSAGEEPTSGPARRLSVEVLETYPHDPTAFTQGLEIHEGMLYEGTGQYGESDLRAVDWKTGEVAREVDLPDAFFGEGITVVGDMIWQLTWQEGAALRHDLATFTGLGQEGYTGEGWGLCHDPERTRLVMSNGSADLTFRNPETFEPTGTVTVTLDGQPLTRLNELECVDDKVWANVWQTDQIVRINPDSGRVEAVVDASGLLSADEQANADVLNGIAVVPDSDTFLITGKLWPWLYEVRFVPAD